MSAPFVRPRTALTAALLVLPMVAGGFLLQGSQQRASALLEQVSYLVGTRYVDSLSSSAIAEMAARGLVDQLNDPYSELMSPRESEDFSRGAQGRYGGTGMYIGAQDGGVLVHRVFPHTPAEDAGVVEGDWIVAVDSTPTAGLPLDKVSGMLRGEPGTEVTVTYSRPGIAEPLVYQLVRREIHIPAVLYSAVLGDAVGYIPLQTFNENASDEVADAVRSLRANGAKRLLLDLRGNPGGMVEQSLSISSLFLPQGLPVLTIRTRGGPPETDSSRGPPLAPDIPVIVLIDGASASASEIVAGSLQDHDRALVLGTTSYGKGLVQSLYSLAGGYALKITTGKWHTPSGRTIHRDRTLLPDGRYVEVQRDSLETDSVRKERPVYRSTGGRIVYGGGGITPDVIVAADTLTTAEQAFTRAVAPHGATVSSVLRDYSIELKGSVRPGFAAPEAWAAETFARLRAAGVVIEPEHRAAATRILLRDLEIRVARQAFGDAEVRKRTAADDPQLSRALQMLAGAETQVQVFDRARR